MSGDREHLVYHVAERADWREAMATGEYRRSTRGMSFDEVGFIHCSTAAQVGPVLGRFYEGVDDLVLLTIAADQFGDDLRYEHVDGSAELFPHLYRPLPVAAVSVITDIAELDLDAGP